MGWLRAGPFDSRLWIERKRLALVVAEWLASSIRASFVSGWRALFSLAFGLSRRLIRQVIYQHILHERAALLAAGKIQHDQWPIREEAERDST